MSLKFKNKRENGGRRFFDKKEKKLVRRKLRRILKDSSKSEKEIKALRGQVTDWY